ncbi:thiopurine S-methyltransferase [Bdellovibrionota bacterium FG-1]
MEPQFWLERWAVGKIGFHQDEFEPMLLKHWPKRSGGRVFVPFSGKSRDLLWLSQNAVEGSSTTPVLGVELSPVACEAFFAENFPSEIIQKRPHGPFRIYQGGPFTLDEGDFFNLTPSDLEDVTGIYDRAALIALPPELRQKYAAHLKALVASLSQSKPVFLNFKMLLSTLEYPQDRFAGPPFSVTPEEVARLYGAPFQVKHLEACDVSAEFTGPLAGAKVLQHAFEVGLNPT